MKVKLLKKYTPASVCDLVQAGWKLGFCDDQSGFWWKKDGWSIAGNDAHGYLVYPPGVDFNEDAFTAKNVWVAMELAGEAF